MESQNLPADFGPIYKETLMGRWPVEPWNTGSNLAFLIVIVYWLLKIHKEWHTHKVILITMMVTGIGFIGGTVYHSTRSHLFWLLLDWVPIVINASILAIYFWQSVGIKKVKLILLTLLPILLNFLLFVTPQWRSTVSASAGYLALVISVLLPLYFYAKKFHFQYSGWLVVALVSVVSALTLRTLDQHPVMDVFPMGTHFMWHLLGALTCHFMAQYVFKTRQQELIDTRSSSRTQT